MAAINVEIPSALIPLFQGEARYRVAYGGRGSAKSHTFGRMADIRAYEKPRRILCARELQNSIKDSVHHLLAEQIGLMGLSGFEIGESYIRHANGSEFIFRGLRSNAAEIKSMEGIDIVWVEEAQKVSAESWQLLIPTIRKPGSEIWVTFNPEHKTDATSFLFIESPPPDAKIVKINHDQNPWFPEALEKERLYCKSVDPVNYPHIWEGDYKDPTQGGRVVPGWTFANVDEGCVYQHTRRLYLSCDFNVDPMCWVIAHIDYVDGKRHYQIIDEIAAENSNIAACTEEFVRRYGTHTAGIVLTGDANSGNARSDQDDKTRTRFRKIENILSDYGVKNFVTESNRSNPFVESRIEAFNLLVSNHDRVRRVKVHPKCKRLIYAMENVRYLPGCEKVYVPAPKEIEREPSKKWLRNDMFDAVSYLTWKYDPIVKEHQSHTVPKTIAVPFKV